MRFGGLVAVDDVGFTAWDGERTAVIGPNGAGKTTMFNCLTGFYQPTVGRLRLEQADGERFLLERLEAYRIGRDARVARTFQNIRLFPRMTVLENLLVAQHTNLMRASWYSVAGLLGLANFKRAEREAIEKARRFIDRKSVVEGKSVEGRLDSGGRR